MWNKSFNLNNKDTQPLAEQLHNWEQKGFVLHNDYLLLKNGCRSFQLSARNLSHSEWALRLAILKISEEILLTKEKDSKVRERKFSREAANSKHVDSKAWRVFKQGEWNYSVPYTWWDKVVTEAKVAPLKWQP